jgi:hypothetical protein
MQFGEHLLHLSCSALDAEALGSREQERKCVQGIFASERASICGVMLRTVVNAASDVNSGRDVFAVFACNVIVAFRAAMNA